MDKVLRPERFDTSPNAQDASKSWRHWLATFENFVAVIPGEEVNKLNVLINYVSSDVYQLFCDAATYDEAINLLKNLYVKTPNEIFARHKLATRKQQSGESLDEYLQELKTLSKDCNFGNVTASQYCDEAVRDAFIAGLSSTSIRQRLLENKTLSLQTAFDQARALDTAQRTSETYNSFPTTASAVKDSNFHQGNLPEPILSKEQEEYYFAGNKHQDSAGRYVASTLQSIKCFFCGNKLHPRALCPAKEAHCHKCKKKGHFQRVCKSAAATESQSSYLTLASSHSAVKSLKKACVGILINGRSAQALVDSGSTHNFIHPDIARSCGLVVYPTLEKVTMASSSYSSEIEGYCHTDIILKGRVYANIKLYVLSNLCTDVILGQNWQEQHESITICFGGAAPPVNICGLSTLCTDPPPLFQFLSPEYKPIASKSRRYCMEDKEFISTEINKLLEEGIIELSDSPWRAQVVVTRNENHKKRLVIDYSETINRFTQLDAYPMPRIDDTVNQIAQYTVFSTVDLKSAYHQVPIKEEEKKYTAFEANGRLYQFCRIPFGVTNGAAAFQRTMDNLISEEALKDTFAYLDNITICGRDQAHHDENLGRFMEAAKKRNLVFNEGKCVFSTRTITILGSMVSKGEIKPDPERLKPLRELPAPVNLKAQKRAVGLFSYYSQWIKDFSKKIRPLSQNTLFPLPEEALRAFNLLKEDVENGVVGAIDESYPFQVETDASDHTLSATLNQQGRPVAFFSRTLSGPELKHSSVEKEAAAIVEAVRKWKHYLTGKHFKLITDQKSVAYMFDTKRHSKIKNDKVMRWRIELSMYDFDIVYRAGEENIPADALSRMKIMSLTIDKLYELHKSLCHPGVARMVHFVKSRNLPFSVEDVKRMTQACKECQECKPQYYSPEPSHLIKATQPFERLNLDFKGPLPSNNRCRFMLTIIDEYSRFPFAFPCEDVSAQTVIRSLSTLFSVFGMPTFIHTDRGSGFMSSELKNFLLQKGISSSRTTSYNPVGNGQIERLNGTLWKTITLALKTKGLPTNCWQEVLLDALHSIRSLLCTATNTTPHERMFTYPSKSTSGVSVPSWLTTPGPVLLKRHVRKSKYDPFVDEVDLLEANPQYAHVRFPDGREDTVSIKHLAPSGNVEVLVDSADQPRSLSSAENHSEEIDPLQTGVETQSQGVESTLNVDHQPQPLRRSERLRKEPDRLVYV